tara:strand:- start:9227 stop:10225 length:999 start_codon:yes stop_codon:yes gene_type:complete
MIKFDRPLIKKRLLLLIVGFCLMSGFVSAQTITLNTPADSLTVGEIFNFSITVKSSESFNKIIFPDSSTFGNDLEFLSLKHFKVNSSSDSAEYKLQFFAVEDINIPPLPVKIVINSDTNLVFTEPFQLFHKQVLASEEDPLKPLKPNFDFPRIIWPYLLIILILIATGVFIWWKYFRSNEEEKTEPKPVPIFENPIEKLESILIRIKEQHTESTSKDYKWFYSELSDALRWYVEELYKIPALESTTREVLRYMDAFGVDVEMVKQVRIVLNEADMIKFAKFKPTLDESWKAFHEGWAFFERARIVDLIRVQRMKAEFERQFVHTQEDEHGMG